METQAVVGLTESRRAWGALGPRVGFLLAAVVFMGGLSYGEEVLQPVAFAALLSFILAPVVRFLVHRRIPRVAAVLLVLAMSFGIVGTLGWMVTDQIIELSVMLPKHQGTIIRKIRMLRGATENGFARVSETWDSLKTELEGHQPPTRNAEDHEPPSLWNRLTASSTGRDRPVDPVAVSVVSLPPSPLGQVRNWLGPLVAPLTITGIVMVLSMFILIQLDDLRNRFISIVGASNFSATTEALHDTSHRLGRYLRMQLLVNSSFGLCIAIGLYFIGLPNSLLWGVLAMVFRFLPYIGPWIAASMPIALSLAVFDDWSHPLMTVSLFLVLELLFNNLFEPWLYGSSVGVSSFGVILSAIFWTWLWGPVGLVFAMPFTVCLVVLGQYLPELSFVSVLLAESPSLSLAQQLYQRWTIMDHDPVDRLVADALSHQTPVEFADTALLPALTLAEFDRRGGEITPSQIDFISSATRALIEEYLSPDNTRREPGNLPTAPTPPPCTILTAPAHDEFDQLSSEALAAVLRREGMNAETVSKDILVSELVARVESVSPVAIVIAGVPPNVSHYARYRCKRIRQACPDLPIILGLWNESQHGEHRLPMQTAGATAVVTSFREAVAVLNNLRSVATQPSVEPYLEVTPETSQSSDLRSNDRRDQLKPSELNMT